MKFVYTKQCKCHACLLIPGTPDRYYCNFCKMDVSKKWEEKARKYRIRKNEWLLNSLKNIELNRDAELYLLEIKDQLRRDKEIL